MLQKTLLIFVLAVGTSLCADVSERTDQVDGGSQISEVPYGFFFEKAQNTTIKTVDAVDLTGYENMNIYTGYGIFDKREKNCQYVEFPKNLTMEDDFFNVEVVGGYSYAVSRNDITYDECVALTASYQGVPAAPSSASVDYLLFGKHYKAFDAWIGLEREDCAHKWVNGYGIEQSYNKLASDTCTPIRLNMYSPAGSGSWEFADTNERKRCVIEIKSKDYKRPIQVCAPWWGIDSMFKVENNNESFDISPYNRLDLPKSVMMCTQYDQTALEDYLSRENNESLWYQTQCSQYFSAYAGYDCIEDIEQDICKVNECTGYVENQCRFIEKFSSSVKDYQKGTIVRNGTATEIKVKSGITTKVYKCPPSKPSIDYCSTQEKIRIFPKECPDSDCEAYYSCKERGDADCDDINSSYYCEKVWGDRDGAVYGNNGEIVAVSVKCEGPPNANNPVFIENDNIERMSKNEIRCLEYEKVETTTVTDKKCQAEKVPVPTTVSTAINVADIYSTSDNCVRTNTIEESMPSNQFTLSFSAKDSFKTNLLKVPLVYDINVSENRVLSIGSIQFNAPQEGDTEVESTMTADELAQYFESVDGFTIGDANRSMEELEAQWGTHSMTGTQTAVNSEEPVYFDKDWYNRRVRPFLAEALESIIDVPDGGLAQTAPAYSWVNYNPNTDKIALDGDDVMSSAISIGFTFPFFDREFSAFQLDSNGNIRLDTSVAQNTKYSNASLGSSYAPAYTIYPYWDDLMLDNHYYSSGAAIYVTRLPQLTAITYYNLKYYATDDRVTFQVLLYPDGRIVFQYRDLGGRNGVSASVGVKGGSVEDTIQSSYNTPGSVMPYTAIGYETEVGGTIYVGNTTQTCSDIKTIIQPDGVDFTTASSRMDDIENAKYAAGEVEYVQDPDACYVRDVSGAEDKFDYYKNASEDGVVLVSIEPMSETMCETYAEDLEKSEKPVAYYMTNGLCRIEWGAFVPVALPVPETPPSVGIVSKEGSFTFTQKGTGEIFAVQSYLDGEFGYSSSWLMPIFDDNIIKINGREIYPVVNSRDLAVKYDLNYHFKNKEKAITTKREYTKDLPGMQGEWQSTAMSLTYANVFYGGLIAGSYVLDWFNGEERYSESTLEYNITRDLTLGRYTPNIYGYDSRKKRGDEALFVWEKYYTGTVDKGDMNGKLEEHMAIKKTMLVDFMGFPVRIVEPAIKQPEDSAFQTAHRDLYFTEMEDSRTSYYENDAEGAYRDVNVAFYGATNSVSIFVPYQGDYELMALDEKMNILSRRTIYSNYFIESSSIMDYAKVDFALDPLFNLAEGIDDGTLDNACRHSASVEWGGGVSGVYYEEGVAESTSEDNTPNRNCQKSNNAYVKKHSAMYIAIRPVGSDRWYLVNMIHKMPFPNRVYLTVFGALAQKEYVCFKNADCTVE